MPDLQQRDRSHYLRMSVVRVAMYLLETVSDFRAQIKQTFECKQKQYKKKFSKLENIFDRRYIRNIPSNACLTRANKLSQFVRLDKSFGWSA